MDNLVRYKAQDVSYENVSENGQAEDTQVIPQKAADDSFVTKVDSISNLVSQNVDVVNKVLDVTTQIADVYRESQQLAAKVETVKEYGKIELAKTAAKFQVTKSLIEETFGERREALASYYKVLDSAIENGNEDMILKAMQMIGSVVVTSPLSDIQEFVKAFGTKGAPLLDF